MMILLKSNPNVTKEQLEKFEEYVFTFRRKNYTIRFAYPDRYRKGIKLEGRIVYDGVFSRYVYEPTEKDYQKVFEHLSKKFPDMVDKLIDELNG